MGHQVSGHQALEGRRWVPLDEALDGRRWVPGGQHLQGGRRVPGLGRLSGHTHKNWTVSVRRRWRWPLHHHPIGAERHEVVPDRWRPPLGQEVGLSWVDQTIIGEAAVIGHEVVVR